MNISLTRQLEQFVARQVKTGRYTSASEVVREGLRLLQEKELAERSKLDALKQAVEEGVASGPALPLDMERIIQRSRQRRAAAPGGSTARRPPSS